MDRVEVCVKTRVCKIKYFQEPEEKRSEFSRLRLTVHEHTSRSRQQRRRRAMARGAGDAGL